MDQVTGFHYSESISYAEKIIKETNHIRGGRSYYDAHIYPVLLIGELFMYLIPKDDRGVVRAALALHDSIEDHRLTYNDVKAVACERVADIVYAVTNEKGKNRKERANSKYYKGIREVQYASFVKICDRIHNTADSRLNNSSMYYKYIKETSNFINSLECEETEEYTLMFHFLNHLIN